MKAALVLLFGLLASCATSSEPDSFDASRPIDSGKDSAGDSKIDTSVSDSGCAPSELRCGDKCVNPTTDPANCGMCGKACGTDSMCASGACACSGGKTSCGGTCVDTSLDSANCGGCGKICLVGEKCSESKCQAACPAGQSRCSGSCINTATDADNCGGCAKVCGSGESCVASTCVCDFPTKSCGGKCVNVNFDANNCGDCGKVCPSGTGGTAGCTGGSCVLTCSAGFGNCNDVVSDGCEAEYAKDNNNCGACGVKCPTLTSVCQAGACKTCPSGTILCGGSCVNRLTDPKNCGACGVICAGSTPNCSAGACVLTCSAGFGNCNDVVSDGCEAEYAKDNNNCGACGVKCPTLTSVCQAGACKTCPSGTILCGGSCVNRLADPKNCGACGVICAGSTPNCSAGACVASACLTCTTGTITKDIPFGSVTGWTNSGCCSGPPPNYLVANGTSATAIGTFADEIPTGSVVKSVTVKFGIEHSCETPSNAMDFQLNGTSVGNWNTSKGPDCTCGDTRVGDATFSAPLTAYKPGMTNTVSIVHNGSGSCHEAITNVPSAPSGTAMRVVITYGCP